MKKQEFLMIPRQILYSEVMSLSQKLTLSALYYLLTNKSINKNGITIEERLKNGISTKIASKSTLKELTNLSINQIKDDLSFFINNNIIDVFKDKENNEIIAASVRSNKLFDLFSIHIKKQKNDLFSGYIPMNSYILDNDLNLTEKFLSLLSIASDNNNKPLSISNKKLGKWLGKEEITIKRSMKSLKEKGLIELEVKPNSRVVHTNIEKYKETSNTYIEKQINIQQNNIKIDKIVNNNQNAGRDINNIQNYNIILSDKESLKLIKEIVNNSKFPELIKFISENKYLINKGGE